jgi:hypothetical protein
MKTSIPMKFALAASLVALMTAAPVFAQPAPLVTPATPPGPPAQTGAPVQTVFTSKIGFFDNVQQPGAQYPRVIQLKYFPGAKGALLATFSRRGDLPIYRSTDNGDTWQLYSEVPNLRGQPSLYELPVKMGEFPAGTVMAAGNGAPGPDPSKHTLDVSYSSDGGKSWHYLSTIAVGGNGRYDPADRAGLSPNQNPIFEPYLYADSAGRLVAFYSDERDKKDGYSQLLDHKVSTDGGRTWGDQVFDVAIADGLTRPGMTVIAKDGHGKFYMSYEMVGLPGHALEPRNNLAHFRTSDDGDNFGDYRDYGTLIQDRWHQYLNGTPYIVWSPWGGPNGSLLATGRSVVRYDLGRVGNGMMINRNGGQGLWTLLETPIDFNPDTDGYSQTMIPLGDGSEILQLVTVNSRVEYAKFKLPADLPKYGFPWDGTKPTDARKVED